VYADGNVLRVDLTGAHTSQNPTLDTYFSHALSIMTSSEFQQIRNSAAANAVINNEKLAGFVIGLTNLVVADNNGLFVYVGKDTLPNPEMTRWLANFLGVSEQDAIARINDLNARYTQIRSQLGVSGDYIPLKVLLDNFIRVGENADFKAIWGVDAKAPVIDILTAQEYAAANRALWGIGVMVQSLEAFTGYKADIEKLLSVVHKITTSADFAKRTQAQWGRNLDLVNDSLNQDTFFALFLAQQEAITGRQLWHWRQYPLGAELSAEIKFLSAEGLHNAKLAKEAKQVIEARIEVTKIELRQQILGMAFQVHGATHRVTLLQQQLANLEEIGRAHV
jgi:hypothetical protein